MLSWTCIGGGGDLGVITQHNETYWYLKIKVICIMQHVIREISSDVGKNSI